MVHRLGESGLSAVTIANSNRSSGACSYKTSSPPNLYRIETRRPPLGEGSTTVADTLSPLERWVVHRQSGDKPGQLRFRHCGSGGHRIRKRTHGARTVRARFRQHPHGHGNNSQCNVVPRCSAAQPRIFFWGGLVSNWQNWRQELFVCTQACLVLVVAKEIAFVWQ